MVEKRNVIEPSSSSSAAFARPSSMDPSSASTLIVKWKVSASTSFIAERR
ncbi:unannotated protein [freshwater metagenome]|uniref:Unannotated protein n=1 Tax=freshwater metagenome TaxID=449393 RepID=A0A6J6GAB3_9ZZZZ